MVWAPTVVGVYVTEQLVLTAPVMVFVVGLPSGQLAKAVGARSAVKLTVPVGAVAELGVLSVTVAVQLVGLPTGTVAGAQLTTVLVRCWRAVTTKVPELPRWVVSPP
jgi:hypothetical protein